MKGEKEMKRTRINMVVDRLLRTFVLLSLAVLLAGCAGLSARVISCPEVKSTCADSELQEVTMGKKRYYVSKTFVILVTHGQGQISSASAAVTDSFGTTVNIDATDIYEPQTHTLIYPSYWAVRLDWTKLSAKGIRVEAATEDRVWTVVIDTAWDNKQDSMTLEFLVTD
jgi:hypothetical protein